MIDRLIFDFDGTISDSYPQFVKFFHLFAEENGLTLPITDEELFRALNVNVRRAFETTGWNQNCTYLTFLDDFHNKQIKYALDFKAFDEAVELLQYAAQTGRHNYIYTHSGPIVSEMLKNMGILHLFDFILDASYSFPVKPKPDALLFLSEKFSLDPKNCMMIGDRPIDALAGMNAGMTGCLWDAYGFFPDAEVDHKVKKLSEIKNLI